MITGPEQEAWPGWLGVFLRYWLPFLAFCSVICFASSLSKLPVELPPIGFIPVDKVAHALEYSVLGCLAVRGVAKGLGGLFTAAEAAAVTVLFGLGFGALDEVHQYYVPGRSVELGDVAADVFGVSFACLAYHLVRLRRSRVKNAG